MAKEMTKSDEIMDNFCTSLLPPKGKNVRMLEMLNKKLMTFSLSVIFIETCLKERFLSKYKLIKEP